MVLPESTKLHNLLSTYPLWWLPAPLALYTMAFSVPLTMLASLAKELFHLLLPCLICFFRYLPGLFSQTTFSPNEDFPNQHILNCIYPHLLPSYIIPFWYISYSVCSLSNIHYHENTVQRFCLCCSLHT